MEQGREETDGLPVGTARQPTTLASLISGSVGGAAQVLVGQPLVSWPICSAITISLPDKLVDGMQDTIKTRSQISPIGMFTGPMDVARKTISQEGFLALYKGRSLPHPR